jgi:hypothetical protein
MTLHRPHRLDALTRTARFWGWLLVVPIGMGPAIAALNPALTLESGQLPNSEISAEPLQIAQVTTNSSVLYFPTPTYTVHVYRVGDGYRTNVYNNASQIVEHQDAVTTLSVDEDFTTFSSTGTRNGALATYQVLVDPNDQLTLQILDAAGGLLVQEFASGDALVSLASNQRPDPARSQTTILAFETNTYATRVFRRAGGEYFMNVYNRISGVSEQNGVQAALAPAVPPNERQASYVSRGTYNGIPAQYFTRIDGSGQTVLEIISDSGQPLLLEPGVGPVVLNIPAGDLPSGVSQIEYVNTAYIAAVFGDASTLNRVQQLYPGAVAENSALGDFINVGAFANRDLAMARVFELRARGFNSRLVYRRVQYR